MYKVMVSLWTNYGDDYIDQEYSGIEHQNKTEAQRELKEAQKYMKKHYNNVHHVYIEEV